MTNFTPTIQQTNVANYFMKKLEAGERASIFLSAVAGSGKTSTIMMIIELLEQFRAETGKEINACSLSFNTNIRDASQAKLSAMGSAVSAKTTNQMGRSILVGGSNAGACRYPGTLETRKYQNIIENLLIKYKNDRSYFKDFKQYTKAKTAILTLVHAFRSTRTSVCEKGMIELVGHYNLFEKVDLTASYTPLLLDVVKKAIAEGIVQYQTKGLHDYDDQIILPLDLDVVSPEWDIIFIDEAQDLNRARLEMITRCIKPNGILFFVGDSSQAIQGFTFSDTKSVQTIIETTGAVVFPLSVCWRCDEKIIRLAQSVVSTIEAHNNTQINNPKHNIVNVVPKAYIDLLQSGTKNYDPDLVLSRIKAPLVTDCLAAIRAGKSAIVRGRDIGSSIVAFLKDALKYPVQDFESLLISVEDHTNHKIDRMDPIKDELAISEVFDQYQTVEALVSGYQLSVDKTYDLEAFQAFIESKFSDTTDINADGVKPIVFSTIHKAKGLEYDRVFLIETGKLPHPAAKAGWQLEQEYNILYVAITRAKHALYFVNMVPGCLTNAYESLSPATTEAIELPSWEELDEESETPIIAEKTAKGRKKRAESDKSIQIGMRLDPSVHASLNKFVEMLAASENFKQLIPNAGGSLAANDVFNAALLAFPPFKAFFEESPEYQEYLERQERLNEYNRKRAKKAKKAPTEPDPTDDPDNDGGGVPAPSSEVIEDMESQVTQVIVEREPDNYVCKGCNRIFESGELERYLFHLKFCAQEEIIIVG